ncbi:capsule biosynthesis protein [Rhodopila sp.]|uniref:capsule biosynthesis protein n=1 Tax=Rhodopila sp. TaxID=2480087 RepID=UPI003D1014B6
MLARRGWFMLFVLLPTLLTAGYYYGIAADQYESEARFIVRGTQSNGPSISGLGQILGMTAGLSAAQSESFSVDDYMASHDAVAALQNKLDLIAMFRRPEADFFARLWWPDPSAETLLRYYRDQVTIRYNEDTGITTIKANTFEPVDSRNLVQALLSLGEARVNEFNQRAIEDTVKVAQDEVDRAEKRITAAQRALTTFRMTERDIDPQKTTTAQLALINTLQQQLAQARAQFAGINASVHQDSPQFVALQDRIHALEGQIATESARLTGQNGALAPVLANYEQLTLQREFAQTSYTSALTALENARLQAMRQQLFVVNVVRPNLPQRALFPHSSMMVATVFLGLLLSYSIGWLIIAGMREHAA